MNKMRVLLVDDHPIFREGLSLLLERDGQFDVVGEAGDGREAVDKVQQLLPDLVIMDIGMPGMNGLEATHQIRSRFPSVKILMLTVHGTDEHFFDALEAGASGYVLKGGDSKDLLYAMQAVGRGDVFLYPSLGRKIVEDYLGRVKVGEQTTSWSKLSNREQQILQLIAEGFTNQEIANQLQIAVSTVQTHRGHIMEKLNLHSRAQLLSYALRAGLLRHQSK